jgi:GNAT superfamily N-acetyltransferase
MYVVPEHRDAGVGRYLLDALVAHADAEGLERVVLSPSERSVPFYRRAGFDPADQLLLRPHPGTAPPSGAVSPA